MSDNMDMPRDDRDDQVPDIIDFAAKQMSDTIRADRRRAAFTTSLRALADFLDAHPGVPCPRYETMNVFLNDREELAAVARLGTWEKVYNDNWFTLKMQFGEELTLEVNTNRNTVCRKVVVGTRIVAAVEAKPEHEEDVTEWVCDDAALLGSER